MRCSVAAGGHAVAGRPRWSVRRARCWRWASPPRRPWRRPRRRAVPASPPRRRRQSRPRRRSSWSRPSPPARTSVTGCG
ncbi:hypothetical protein F8274_23200 [Micromonospora sp. AMSO31t]|nr:hypothetical protein F8274_23200 [Micromonospora sp. AMSO31t]